MVDQDYRQQNQEQQASDGAPQVQVPQLARPSTSGLAIAGLVIGILAIATSFLPIVNNVSFFMAIVGVILSIAGIVGINRGKHSGKGIAVAGIVLGVLAIVIVLATQALFSAAIDQASSDLNAGSTPTAAASASAAASSQSDGSAASSEAAGQAEIDYQNLSVGQTVELKNGASITVNSIEGGYANYDGSEIVCVNVTCVNGGSKNLSFSSYDWKAEDADGAQRSQAYYSEAQNELNSGNLSAGGQVTGNIYFDAPVSKIHYYGNMFDSSSTAAWVA